MYVYNGYFLINTSGASSLCLCRMYICALTQKYKDEGGVTEDYHFATLHDDSDNNTGKCHYRDDFNVPTNPVDPP